MALPAVVDRQPELETLIAGVEGVTGFADDGLDAADLHGRDHAEAIRLADMGEVVQLGLRQLAHGAEETVVAGTGGEGTEIGLQCVGVPRFDEAHRHRAAAARTHNVGILSEIIQTQGNHGRLPSFPEGRSPASLFGGDAGVAAAQARQNGFPAS